MSGPREKSLQSSVAFRERSAEQRGAQTKSERTRARILAAAQSVFRDEGYEKATVRGIAATATIDPSMVIRYFGSKESLFVEASQCNLGLSELGKPKSSDIGRLLTRHFFERWEENPGWLMLLRTASSNEGVADRLRDNFARQLADIILRFPPDETSGLRASLVISQLLGFAYSRYILRLPPFIQLGPEKIVESISPTIQRYIVS